MDDGEVEAGLGKLDGDRRASMVGRCWRRGMSCEPTIATSRELACSGWEPERLMAAWRTTAVPTPRGLTCGGWKPGRLTGDSAQRL